MATDWYRNMNDNNTCRAVYIDYMKAAYMLDYTSSKPEALEVNFNLVIFINYVMSRRTQYV